MLRSIRLALELFTPGRLSAVVSHCSGIDFQVQIIFPFLSLCLSEFLSMLFEVTLCTPQFMCDAREAMDRMVLCPHYFGTVLRFQYLIIISALFSGCTTIYMYGLKSGRLNTQLHNHGTQIFRNEIFLYAREAGCGLVLQ